MTPTLILLAALFVPAAPARAQAALARTQDVPARTQVAPARTQAVPARTQVARARAQQDTAAQVSALSGVWGGWVEIAGTELWFQVRADGQQLWLEDFTAGPPAVPAASHSREGEHASFVYDAGIGTITYHGRVDGRRWVGDVRCDGYAPGRFAFTRFHDRPEASLDRALGRYTDEQGRVVWSLPRTFDGIRLVERTGEHGFSDFEFDAWLPLDDDAFFPATSDTPFDLDGALHVGEDALSITAPTPRTLTRAGGEVRRARFRSDDVELSGWLMLPPGPGPHPAVAYAHGSGYVSADSPFDLYVSWRLVEDLGLAVLRWDKRGVGRSTGDQRLASYHDLAADVHAAHTWLRAQPGVDPARVGLGGLSQGPSWPIPIAAAREPAVAFVIALSASAQTAMHTNIFNWTNLLRRRGFSDAEIEAARAFYLEVLPLPALGGDDAQAALDERLRAHANEAWFEAACELGGLRTPVDDPIVQRWRAIWNVDPIDSWRQVNCPVFQAWGAADPLVDVTRSLARLRALTEETGQENFTWTVYPAPAAHAVGSSSTPTFFDDLSRWFASEVEGSAAQPAR